MNVSVLWRHNSGIVEKMLFFERDTMQRKRSVTSKGPLDSVKRKEFLNNFCYI